MNTAPQFQRKPVERRLCVAPMMDWTDRHCRYFHRLLAPSALLYTEMLTTGAVLHGDRDRLLGYDAAEHPLALQLGGSEPADLASSARIAEAYGYDEVNLNVGCPSDRVQRGRFGACLMLEPGLVRDCVAAMRGAVDIPVTVKTRLGVDRNDSYAWFSDFVGGLAESGCAVFVVHARKAWLSGLSPKENRDVPELRYEWVYRLKRAHPGLTIVVNGGIGCAAEVERHLRELDGVMLGRAAYHDPWLLAELQASLFPSAGDSCGSARATAFGDRFFASGETAMPSRPALCARTDAPRRIAPAGMASREAAVEAMTEYLQRQVRQGVPAKHVSRHLLGLFQGQPGARRWRRYISQHAHLEPANGELLLQALAHMRQPGAARADADTDAESGSATVHAVALECRSVTTG